MKEYFRISLLDVPSPRLTSTEALRALGHTTRLRILARLQLRGDSTATECAEEVGESASSCSYHLRTLAKHGFVEEVPSTDGRERRWHARVVSLDFDAGAHADEDFQAASALARAAMLELSDATVRDYDTRAFVHPGLAGSRRVPADGDRRDTGRARRNHASDPGDARAVLRDCPRQHPARFARRARQRAGGSRTADPAAPSRERELPPVLHRAVGLDARRPGVADRAAADRGARTARDRRRRWGRCRPLALIPNLLFSLHAGAWVDRRGRRREMMLATDIVRGL